MAYHSGELDALFRALSDPTRRAVLARLARGPATISELAAPHAMALPSLMGHIAKLQAAGLIDSTKQGRTRHCRLKPGALSPAHGWLDAQRALWEDRLDRFDDHVINHMKDQENGA